jgi:phosphoadenosine phosphosulfate reductase
LYSGQTVQESTSNIADVSSASWESLPESDVAGFVLAVVDHFGDRLALAHSLAIEDTVLLHHLADAARRTAKRPRVFTLDTGRLPEESYQQLERLRDRYPLPIEVVFPQAAAVEALYRRKGPFSFFESVEERKGCCAIRKLEPLARALVGADAWMVGLRRAQSPTREQIERVEREPRGRYKLSPLAHVSDEEIWADAERLDVPVHALHRRGYPSIGCAPCTRAVAPGESMRAGRWWWEDPEHKECGLHTRNP